MKRKRGEGEGKTKERETRGKWLRRRPLEELAKPPRANYLSSSSMEWYVPSRRMCVCVCLSSVKDTARAFD